LVIERAQKKTLVEDEVERNDSPVKQHFNPKVQASNFVLHFHVTDYEDQDKEDDEDGEDCKPETVIKSRFFH